MSLRAICTRARPREWLPALLGSGGTALEQWGFFEERQQAQQMSEAGDMPLPPPALRKAVDQNWGGLDEDFDFIGEVLPENNTVRQHLLNSFAVLHLWRQSQAQCRAGLFHMAYMAPGSIPFGLLAQGGEGDAHDRQDLARIIGQDAEEMVAIISSDAMSWERLATSILSGVAPDFTTLPCGEVLPLTRSEFVRAAMVAVADIAECAHEAIDTPADDSQTAHYVGHMKPAVEMYWMSQLCEQFREDLDIAPPIFDGCTQTICRTAEVEARDAYWHAVQQQARQGSSGLAELEALELAVHRNPFVAEPHVLMSQVLVQHRRYDEAAGHAAEALRLFFQWGTPWDKRAPLRQWVAFSQILLHQASFGSEGFTDMPFAASGMLPLPEYTGPLISPVVVQC